MNSTLFFCFNY